VNLDEEVLKSSEPRDKLDAHEVNGTEDAVRELHKDSVRRRQRRILQGLLEPDAVGTARPVLRGAGRSNASRLPGLRHDVARYE
jgi:hypothetical protein